MLRKTSTLALLVGLMAGASPAFATIELWAGNPSAPRLFTIDDLSDGTPMTSKSQAFFYDGLAYSMTAGILYGVNADGANSDFFTLDGNGAHTIVASNIGYNVDDIVFGPGGTLYGGNRAGQFFSINTATGTRALLGTGANPIVALAYDPISGIVYGGNDESQILCGVNSGTACGELFRINVANGAQTMVDGDVGRNIHGMAIHPVTGVLYAGNDLSIAGTSDFFQINKLTGAVTMLDETSTFDIQAMTFVPEPGTAFLLASGLTGLSIAGRRRRS